jgi:hypothetical protein
MMADTGNVACKLPHGLVIEAKQPDGSILSLELAGSNDPGNVMGWGITRDVDKGLFDAWVKEKGFQLPAYRRGSIFFYGDRGDIRDVIAERAKDETVATGLEPINPDKPAPGVEATDEQKKQLAEQAPAPVPTKAKSTGGRTAVTKEAPPPAAEPPKE